MALAKDYSGYTLGFLFMAFFPQSQSPNLGILYSLDWIKISQMHQVQFRFCLAVFLSISLSSQMLLQEETRLHIQYFAWKFQPNIQVHCLLSSAFHVTKLQDIIQPDFLPLQIKDLLSFSFQKYFLHFLRRPHQRGL